MSKQSTRVSHHEDVEVVDSQSIEVERQLLRESDKSLVKAIGNCRNGILWSLFVSCFLIVDGYTGAILNSFCGYPEFKLKYGKYIKGELVIEAHWQTGFSLAYCAGCMIGGYACGLVSKSYGYKRTLALALVLYVGAMALLLFGSSPVLWLVGNLAIGIPSGAFGAVATVYAGDMVPHGIRDYVTTSFNVFWIVGQIASQGVLRACLKLSHGWSFLAPLLIQGAGPVVLGTALCFCPESPWWLLQQGEIKKARTSLKRLTCSSSGTDPDLRLEVLRKSLGTCSNESNTQETNFWHGIGSCFKWPYMKRTLICSMVFLCQSACMGPLMGYSGFFFQTAGLGYAWAFNLGMVQYAISALGTGVSWLCICMLGRKIIYGGGLLMLAMAYSVMGCVSLFDLDEVPWVVASMQVVSVFIYGCTIGPLALAIVADMAPKSMSAQMVGVSRNVYHLWNMIGAVVYAYLMNPAVGNMRGRIGFVQTGICGLCCIMVVLWLPETKDKSLSEVESMFSETSTSKKGERKATGSVETGGSKNKTEIEIEAV